MNQLTKITLAWELYEAGLLKGEIAQSLEVNRDTIRLWFKEIQSQGLSCFLDSYLSVKKGERVKRQVNPVLKRWIREIRERESDCCGQKIGYFLLKEHGIFVSIPKIYVILMVASFLSKAWKEDSAGMSTFSKQMVDQNLRISLKAVSFNTVLGTGSPDLTGKMNNLTLRALTGLSGKNV